MSEIEGEIVEAMGTSYVHGRYDQVTKNIF